MSEQSTHSSDPHGVSRSAPAWRWIGVAAAVIIIGGVITAWRMNEAMFAAPAVRVLAVLIVVIAIAFACSMWGVDSLARRVNQLRESVERLEAKHAEHVRSLSDISVQPTVTEDVGSDTLPFKTDGPTAAQWQELVTEVEALRARLDHSPAAPAGRAGPNLDDLEESLERVDELLSEGEFHKAGELATTLRSRYGTDNRVAMLSNRIESARRLRESRDLAEISQEVADLVSMSAWSQARQRAQFLQEQHPDSPEARQLMLRIEGDFRVAQEEQQRRMYAEVQRFVSRKRWSEALAAAHTFIERFAGSDDAEAVRMQLPTLEANAEIETRQQLEAQIMALVKHGRYIEATALAKRVIEQYPDSPQAEALRRQIDRLEELATNPDAPPARVRID